MACLRWPYRATCKLAPLTPDSHNTLHTSCIGEYHFENGDVYLGNWVGEMMEGVGKLVCGNEEEYEGALE